MYSIRRKLECIYNGIQKHSDTDKLPNFSQYTGVWKNSGVNKILRCLS